MKLHPDELPHVLVHQTDPGAVNYVSDVGRNPAKTRHEHESDFRKGYKTKDQRVKDTVTNCAGKPLEFK